MSRQLGIPCVPWIADATRRIPTGATGTVNGQAGTVIIDAVQLSLPSDKRHSPALDSVIDGVRARFGDDAVERAVLLGRHTGISVPLLPD